MTGTAAIRLVPPDRVGAVSAPLVDSVCLVTGGAGFIGSHLCDRLVGLGNEVVCMDNLVATNGSDHNVRHLRDHPGFRFVEGSVVDPLPDGLMSTVDYVFHEAVSKNTVSIDDPVRDLEVNARGTLQLLLAARDAGVRKFVHASTGSVYGEHVTGPHSGSLRDPVSFYGVSKTAGELYCRVVHEMFGLDYTVIRYFHVIGPRQDSSDVGGVLPIFVRNCLEGTPIRIFGTGEQTRSFTSVSDVVDANVLAATLTEESRGFFDCASGIRVTINELAEFVQGEMSSSHDIIYEPFRRGDIMEFNIDNSTISGWGVNFNTDWRSVVRSVIDSMRV